MYASSHDPYCYPGTAVLRNKADLRNADALEEFESAIVAQRLEETLPGGRLTVNHYRAVRRHLFGDVYSWAGRFRTTRISKGTSMFCYPENIASELRKLFAGLRHAGCFRGLGPAEFAGRAAHFLAELNAIHAFREGNGRTQMAFVLMLAAKAGHPVHIDRLHPDALLGAMITSFSGNEGPLEELLHHLVA